MREAQPAEPESRLQLVVAGAERTGAVENADPALLDLAQVPQTVLDPVERPSHVEATKDDVAGANALLEDRGLDQPGPQGTVTECRHKELVRDRGLPGDDPHGGRAGVLDTRRDRHWQ